MAFTHYKVGKQSGAWWTVTQILYDLVSLAQDDVILITGTPNSRVHRTCERVDYHTYTKAAEIPVGIQEMRLLCDYKAVDAIYEEDTFIGTLIWNRSYWADIIEYETFRTLTLLLSRAVARAGINNVDILSSSRGVVADLLKVGNVAESNEKYLFNRDGWNATHLFVYITMDYDLHDKVMNREVYSHCINVLGPWKTYFTGIADLDNKITDKEISAALEAEVSTLFNLPVMSGNINKILRGIPSDNVAMAASRAFIETAQLDGKEVLKNA